MNRFKFVIHWWFLFFLLVVIVGCGKSSEEIRKEARIKLGQMGINYSEEEFMNRIINNDDIAAKLFIDAGIDVNAKGKDGYTPLINAAAGGGNLEIVKLLIDKGAEVNVSNKYGKTALEIAVDKSYTDIVKLLEGAGARLFVLPEGANNK